MSGNAYLDLLFDADRPGSILRHLISHSVKPEKKIPIGNLNEQPAVCVENWLSRINFRLIKVKFFNAIKVI